MRVGQPSTVPVPHEGGRGEALGPAHQADGLTFTDLGVRRSENRSREITNSFQAIILRQKIPVFDLGFRPFPDQCEPRSPGAKGRWKAGTAHLTLVRAFILLITFTRIKKKHSVSNIMNI